MRRQVGFGQLSDSIRGVLMTCTVALSAFSPIHADEPGEPEYGVFIQDGVAVKYRIIHRVPGEYTARKIASVEAEMGWFSMHAEYEYGAQILPRVVDAWLTGIVGNMRELISCTIPADRLKVRTKDEFDVVGIPRVGDRITVKKRVKYEFAIEWRVRERATLDVGFFEIPVFEIMHNQSKKIKTGWMTKETQLWEVVQILEANGPAMPINPASPIDPNMPVPMP
jgi:hypothetical protein